MSTSDLEQAHSASSLSQHVDGSNGENTAGSLGVTHAYVLDPVQDSHSVESSLSETIESATLDTSNTPTVSGQSHWSHETDQQVPEAPNQLEANLRQKGHDGENEEMKEQKNKQKEQQQDHQQPPAVTNGLDLSLEDDIDRILDEAHEETFSSFLPKTNQTPITESLSSTSSILSDSMISSTPLIPGNAGAPPTQDIDADAFLDAVDTDLNSIVGTNSSETTTSTTSTYKHTNGYHATNSGGNVTEEFFSKLRSRRATRVNQQTDEKHDLFLQSLQKFPPPASNVSKDQFFQKLEQVRSTRKQQSTGTPECTHETPIASAIATTPTPTPAQTPAQISAQTPAQISAQMPAQISPAPISTQPPEPIPVSTASSKSKPTQIPTSSTTASKPVSSKSTPAQKSVLSSKKQSSREPKKHKNPSKKQTASTSSFTTLSVGAIAVSVAAVVVIVLFRNKINFF